MLVGRQKLGIAVGMILVVVSAVFAGDMDYTWEKWAFPTKIECSIRYDSDGDGQLEEYYPASTEGHFTFKADYPFDHIIPGQSDWTAVFESVDGSVIKLTDASWNGHENNGRKENFYIYPEHQCVKYFYEGTGTWCGYDRESGVYFWGRWTTLPGGKPYFADYLNGASPSVRGSWSVEGCSDQNHVFETTEGTFFATRLEYGRD